jgi:hypothetical protein
MDSEEREDEIRKAEQEMAAMLKRIREAKAGKMNSGLEATYGQVYQRLVRLGARPQVRLKYRG